MADFMPIPEPAGRRFQGRRGEPDGLARHQRDSASPNGRDLIALAQQLARDAERHAILSASLASQADRLMVEGLRLLESPRPAPPEDPRTRP